MDACLRPANARSRVNPPACVRAARGTCAPTNIILSSPVWIRQTRMVGLHQPLQLVPLRHPIAYLSWPQSCQHFWSGTSIDVLSSRCFNQILRAQVRRALSSVFTARPFTLTMGPRGATKAPLLSTSSRTLLYLNDSPSAHLVTSRRNSSTRHLTKAPLATPTPP